MISNNLFAQRREIMKMHFLCTITGSINSYSGLEPGTVLQNPQKSATNLINSVFRKKPPKIIKKNDRTTMHPRAGPNSKFFMIYVQNSF